MTEIHRNFIAGAWVAGDQVTRNINPADLSDVVGEYARATSGQTQEAIAAARAAFPEWSQSNVAARAAALDKIGSEMLERQAELGRLLSREEGKTLAEGIGEVVRAAQIFKFFSGEALRSAGDVLPSVRPGIEVMVTREALGVIGVITPWNFPMAIPAWKIAPALAFGNCVVFKPADLTPGCGWALADIIARAGLPEGVFNLTMGRGTVVGSAIVDGVDALTFTGSVPTGQRIAQQAMEKMTKVQLEMGGKNPLVVLDDADLDTAVECAVNGAFYQTGQRCTASSRLIVTDRIHDRFVSAVQERLRKVVVGDPLEEGTHIGPVVDQNQLEQDQRYIAIGSEEGGRLVYGGERLERSKEGYYLSPALFVDTTNDMRINREEVFGPVASVIRVKDYDEALVVANDTPFGLTSGVITTSLKFANHFRANAKAGLVMVNLPTAGLDFHVPFGGRKASSFGPREQGTYAAEFYTVVKTSYVSVA